MQGRKGVIFANPLLSCYNTLLVRKKDVQIRKFQDLNDKGRCCNLKKSSEFSETPDEQAE